MLRQVVCTVLVSLTIWGVQPFGLAMAEDQARRPNIVLIVADDLRADIVSVYGGIRSWQHARAR